MAKLHRDDGILGFVRYCFLLLSPPVLLAFIMLLPAAAVRGQHASPARGKIELKTASFAPGGFIPKRFTCQAEDVSPALNWTDPPSGIRSFAIIEEDPDAPSGTFVHWVVYDLPATFRRIGEGLSGNEELPGGGRQGTNDFSKTGYSGPCPPPGKPHRYFIRLYALDIKTNLHPGATRQELDSAMQGHVLAQGELMGRFQR
jgi:Raf kinase inhibitor-like YbhB/YbcL family protein